MNTRFARWGNSLALRIPNGIAKELQVSEGVAVDIRVKGGTLVVTPVCPSYDINQLIAAITPENVHAETDTGDDVGNEFP